MNDKPIPWRLNIYADKRGKLTVAEANKDIPFLIKRVFWIYDVPEDAVRGGHSHNACQQVLVCVAGSCRAIAGGDVFQLDEPGKALYLPPGTYLDLDEWQPGTVLLVLCSHHYEEEDYAYQAIDAVAV